MKTNRFWIIFLICISVLCAAAALVIRLGQPSHGGVARIYSNGELVETVDLRANSEPQVISVPAGNGHGVNIIEAEQGRIRVRESDCPGGDCVRQGRISQGSAPIVCLPHRLVIQIEGSADADIDGAVG